MARPITIELPHALGADEAKRRLAEGFGRLQDQLGGQAVGTLSIDQRWDGDVLHFSGGALGQRLTGRIDVEAESVRLEVDLPAILAALADRIAGRLRKEAQLLLAK